MRNTHCMIWNMARIVEKQTKNDCLTCNMARNTEKCGK